MIEFLENQLELDTYLELRASVQWKVLSREQAQKALDNSLYTLCAYENGRPVGMGRIVGDGAVICYVQDLVIRPELQGSGLGSELLQRLIAHVKSLGFPDTTMMLALMCAKGREEFYIKNGFTPRPTPDLGPGMITYLSL